MTTADEYADIKEQVRQNLLYQLETRMAQSEVTRVKRAVEFEREDLEDELGPFNIHTEAGRVYLIPDGCIDPQWEAALNSRHADARLVIKEVT